MRISSNGVVRLKGEEGERLSAYLDSRGIPTIGVGHTGTVDGKPVVIGMVISQNKSTELLLQDIQWVEKAINSSVKTPLTQNQYDALCSLVFNIGATAFYGSTVLKRVNQKDYTAAADAFLMWKKAGKDPEILLPRRRRERALFLS
ncbi:lysozyme [Klebsiella pneumoniae]|uniref:lysozyme n=1 Tax=Klebsiella pneumoniae complex TaxID=3390273 RepID=UPI00050CB815|nr:lysozyme [Klebsiella pneumoniae]HDT2839395.1 lysozyme [Klebsiella pneumoniae subsp. pneumoniae]EKV5869649.1 lysozyme [Klebsiella pneumoniae]ELA2091496.1 lysozyme [Klebsiella pneumoniae]KAB7976417.1 glycoside hydrolase family protein [Klebsiella pneumoniae]KAB7977711.1 glycoside hydrolase family protein [Klebsiella pneumoniae]